MVKRKSSRVLFLLPLMLFIIVGTGCGDHFESYRTTLDVPDDLQRVQLTNPDNTTDTGKLQYTSEEALLFFSQCDGVELETVPLAEVNNYQVAGLYVYDVDLYGSDSSVSYVFKLPYIKLPNGDWSIVVDDKIEYNMSTTILSLPSDDPHGTTIWDISKFSD